MTAPITAVTSKELRVQGIVAKMTPKIAAGGKTILWKRKEGIATNGSREVTRGRCETTYSSIGEHFEVKAVVR